MLSHMSEHEKEQHTPSADVKAIQAVTLPQQDPSLAEGRKVKQQAEQTGRTTYRCIECGATFRFQISLLSHRKLHLKETGLTDQEAKFRWDFPEKTVSIRVQRI
jgi:hypothetical protein